MSEQLHLPAPAKPKARYEILDAALANGWQIHAAGLQVHLNRRGCFVTVTFGLRGGITNVLWHTTGNRAVNRMVGTDKLGQTLTLLRQER